MHGVRVPLDEEGKNAVAVIGEVQGAPLEQAAVGTRARTVARPVEGDAGSFEFCSERIKVAWMVGPVDQARSGERLQLGEEWDGEVGNFRLRRVGRDDF